MRASKAIDPLWQCLCPSWTRRDLQRASVFLNRPRRLTTQCLNLPRGTVGYRVSTPRRQFAHGAGPAGRDAQPRSPVPSRPSSNWKRGGRDFNPDNESTEFLYGRLHSMAVHAKVVKCREVAEYLVKERRQQPSVQIYNALILSNADHEHGAAWRISELWEEMGEAGLQPDMGTCHAALKVLSVHLDHLMRSDVLEYMQRRWYQLSVEGAHDVAAGMLRDGLFEQALQRLDEMRAAAMPIDGWLWDMATYMLCDAGEIEEAFRIMHSRYDAGATHLSQTLWAFLLDKASEARHHAATAFVWSTRVKQGYMHVPSGVCLNVLATAARAGDAVLSTEVFAHLGDRGTSFQPVHYELLMSVYLATSPPDITRALAVLTIMPLEKLEPSAAETRPLYLHLRDHPERVREAFAAVRELHGQGRQIPIALLNLLIECYVEQHNLADAVQIYKLIHTFAPLGRGAQKSFADVETFNMLLRGCRRARPPDADQAGFLVSELLALRVRPTALTYDRLILVFVEAAAAAVAAENDVSDEGARARGHDSRHLELLDWAFRHFADMQPLGWMPRSGTLKALAVQLARARDPRCWDVLQQSDEHSANVRGSEQKRDLAWRTVEEAWAAAAPTEKGNADGDKESASTQDSSGLSSRAQEGTVATSSS